MSERIEAKARSYLAEGRVRVLWADTTRAAFAVRGSDDYEVRYGHGTWYCNCPAKADCAHLFACKMIYHGTAEPILTLGRVDSSLQDFLDSFPATREDEPELF